MSQGTALGGVRAPWQPVRPKSLRPAARGKQAASHHLHRHHLLPPAFTSPFHSTTSSSALTRCPQGKVGLAEPHCSCLWPPSPELKAAKAPLLISDPMSVCDTQGLVLHSVSSTFWFPFSCHVLAVKCASLPILQEISHPCGAALSLGWDVPPALPRKVLRWGQPGLKPRTWREFGLSPPLVRKRQDRGGPDGDVTGGRAAALRQEPASTRAPWHSCHLAWHR